MDACRFLVFTRQDRFPWGFDVAFADLKDAIRSDIPPPNAPATLAAKFPKTHTLINTGQFLNSVAWELMKAEEKGTGGYRPIGAE